MRVRMSIRTSRIFRFLGTRMPLRSFAFSKAPIRRSSTSSAAMSAQLPCAAAISSECGEGRGGSEQTTNGVRLAERLNPAWPSKRMQQYVVAPRASDSRYSLNEQRTGEQKQSNEASTSSRSFIIGGHARVQACCRSCGIVQGQTWDRLRSTFCL